MDEHRYKDWLALWAEDGIYWVPCNDDDIDPARHVSIIYDDRERLQQRVERLMSGAVLAQEPKPRMRRVVSNIEIERRGRGDFGAVELRAGAGERGYAAALGRPHDPSAAARGRRLHIRHKKVLLINSDQEMPLLQFLIMSLPRRAQAAEMPILWRVPRDRAQGVRLGPRAQGAAGGSGGRARGDDPQGGEALSLPGDRFVGRGNRRDNLSSRGSMMEHGRFPYSPIAGRTVVRMPEGARVAVWITPNIEHYHLGQAGDRADADDRVAKARRAELCVARLWRAGRHLADHGNLRAAGFRRHRRAQCRSVRALSADRRGGKPARLGMDGARPNNSMLFTGMPEEAGAADHRGRARHDRARDRAAEPRLARPGADRDRPHAGILAEAGIDYVADWCNDELPYAMKTAKGAIYAIPYTLEIGDIPVFL